jgi:hypothetical protein
VPYDLSTPGVVDLMRSARAILTSMLSGQEELLAHLRAVVEVR